MEGRSLPRRELGVPLSVAPVHPAAGPHVAPHRRLLVHPAGRLPGSRLDRRQPSVRAGIPGRLGRSADGLACHGPRVHRPGPARRHLGPQRPGQPCPPAGDPLVLPLARQSRPWAGPCADDRRLHAPPSRVGTPGDEAAHCARRRQRRRSRGHERAGRLLSVLQLQRVSRGRRPTETLRLRGARSDASDRPDADDSWHTPPCPTART